MKQPSKQRKRALWDLYCLLFLFLCSSYNHMIVIGSRHVYTYSSSILTGGPDSPYALNSCCKLDPVGNLLAVITDEDEERLSGTHILVHNRILLIPIGENKEIPNVFLLNTDDKYDSHLNLI